MAADTNACAAFYDDGTYEMMAWSDCRNMQRPGGPGRLVALSIFHVQGGSGLPNVVTFTGVDLYGLKATTDKIIVRTADTPPHSPEQAKESWFKLDGSQTLVQAVPNPAVAALGGCDCAHFAKDYDDADFDAKVAAAFAKAFELRDDPVPSSGTY